MLTSYIRRECHDHGRKRDIATRAQTRPTSKEGVGKEVEKGAEIGSTTV